MVFLVGLSTLFSVLTENFRYLKTCECCANADAPYPLRLPRPAAARQSPFPLGTQSGHTALRSKVFSGPRPRARSLDPRRCGRYCLFEDRSMPSPATRSGNRDLSTATQLGSGVRGYVQNGFLAGSGLAVPG